MGQSSFHTPPYNLLYLRLSSTRGLVMSPVLCCLLLSCILGVHCAAVTKDSLDGYDDVEDEYWSKAPTTTPAEDIDSADANYDAYYMEKDPIKSMKHMDTMDEYDSY